MADSDGFCGFQKIPEESGIIHGSEEVQLMRTGCETPRFPHMRGLLLATTENSRTRNSFRPFATSSPARPPASMANITT
ncbi:MAG: hypothetical protein C5S47_03490 [Candidatus Methanogasteraceae archaeon]|nr:MAG: hypothetical protein C5S47_03490 [ANME-2 cluster archaeon]